MARHDSLPTRSSKSPIAGNQVPQDLNADTDPSIWSTTFTPDATAFKFVADKPLGNVNQGASSGLVIKFTTDQQANEAGDLYANRFTAFSPTFYNDNKFQLLTSNQVMVRVIGYSIGDLIWFDLDNDGKFTPGVDKAAPEGVQVNVYDKATGQLAKGGSVTTNKDGRWVVNDLPEGDYYAEIPASQFAAGPLEGYGVQPINAIADPNNNVNEQGDHNAAVGPGGSVITGALHLKATVNGSTITGNAPLNDNTGHMPVTPGTNDDFTNFTLDMALKPIPGYTFTKTADPATGTPVMAGSTITYTLRGENTGKTSLDVVISDDLTKVLEFAEVTTAPAATIAGAANVPAPALTGNDLSWAGTLAPGQIVEVTYTVTVGEGHEGKTLNNHASSTATPPHDDPITPPDVETSHPIPGYTLTKSADPASGSIVQPNEIITYTVTGTNTGATVLDPVVITDDLAKVLNNATLEGAPVVTINGQATPPAATLNGTTLSWTGKLEVGQAVVLTYKVKVNADAGEKAVTLNNKVTSSAKPPVVPPITPPEVTTEHPVPGYTFTKVADPVSGSTVLAGGQITYTLTGTNTGATALDPVVINDDLTKVLDHADLVVDPAVTIEGQSGVPAAAVTDGKLAWSGKLEVGQKVVITYTVKLHDDADEKAVVVNNHASSSATPPGEDPITPPDVTTEHPVPGYTFTKVANPISGTAVSPEGYIHYTLTGINTGATVLDPVVINDDLSKVLNNATIHDAPVVTISGGDPVTAPAVTIDGTELSWTGILQKGQKVEITYSVKVNEGTDVGAVVLNNHASSSATPPGEDPITPPDVTTEHPVPGYTFTKVSDPESGTPVSPNGEITYTLTGTNTGATELDVVVNDDLSKVLNHASVVKEPAATIQGVSNVPAATRTGETIAWTGKLAKGQAVTITYTVKLNADAEGVLVNNHASSSATPPGELPPITPPDVETWHPTPGYTFNKVADPASGSTVQEGDTITYTLTGTNFGKTELDTVINDDLSKVLDKADLDKAPVASIVTDGSSSPASTQPVLEGTKLSWNGKLEIGQQVVIVYSVTVKAGGEGKIVNNVASSTATPPVGPPVTPPEVTTEHPIPGFTLAKSADPVSGSTVQPGSKITSTVTGTNTGATVLDPVVITDDMSKVLAHAALVGAPTATIINAEGGKTTAAAPVVNGTNITWTGKLAKGERVELVYTVQVNADAASVTLKNVVTSTATPPGGGELVPPPGTTTHEVPPPPVKPTPTPTPSNPGGNLPQTGTDVPVWLPIGAGLLVLIGVGTLVAARTRREH